MTSMFTPNTYQRGEAPEVAEVDLSGTVRRLGASYLYTNTTNTPSMYVVCSFTIPYPVAGRVYQARGLCTILPNTAASDSDMILSHGLSATTGGTDMMFYNTFHPTASKVYGYTIFGEFTYAGTTGDTPYNVVLKVDPHAGSAYTVASAGAPSILIVDEVL